jgi:hypothetical protein
LQFKPCASNDETRRIGVGVEPPIIMTEKNSGLPRKMATYREKSYLGRLIKMWMHENLSHGENLPPLVKKSNCNRPHSFAMMVNLTHKRMNHAAP